MNSDLKYIYEEILPLKLVHKRIRNMITQLDENQSYKAMKNISDLKKYFLNCEKAQTWLENLNSMLPKDLPVYAYDFSETDIDTIRRVDEILNGYSKDEILKAIENKNDYLKEVKEKLIISNKMESKESQEMLSKLEKMYGEFEEIDLNLVKLKEEEEKSRDYLNEKKESYQLYKSNITKQKKESSSYVVALKYREVIDEFIDINIKDVCLKLNTTLLKYLQEMKFRNNSIGSVDISSKTFDINLYEKNGEMIPSYLFSAGEKQVLLGLVIKAALNLSNNDCFFLFDTPVGRLDKKNREIFTKEVIFTVSNQSFIFATDSDYSEDDYLRIKSRIRAEYKLDRNKNDEIIAVNGSIY